MISNICYIHFPWIDFKIPFIIGLDLLNFLNTNIQPMVTFWAWAQTKKSKLKVTKEVFWGNIYYTFPYFIKFENEELKFISSSRIANYECTFTSNGIHV